MKTKTLLIAFTLTVAPTLSFAMGCAGGHAPVKEATLSCAQGTVYDAETKACVQTSS